MGSRVGREMKVVFRGTARDGVVQNGADTAMGSLKIERTIRQDAVEVTTG